MKNLRLRLGVIASMATVCSLSLSGIAMATPSVITGTIGLSSSSISQNSGNQTTLTISAPALAAGKYTQTLQASGIGSGSGTRFVSAQASTGYTLQYQNASGTWFNTAPAASPVVAVRAVGTVESIGTTSSQMTTLASSVFSKPNIQSLTLGINGSGDGWDVSFDPGYTRIYNVYHHGSPSAIDCHLLSDGTECPGFPFYTADYIGMVTNGHSHVSVASNGDLYLAGSADPNSTGVNTVDGFLCVTPDGVSCGFKVVSNDINPHEQNGWGNFMGGYQIVNNKIWGFAATSAKVACWDISLDALCAGEPFGGWATGLPVTTGYAFVASNFQMDVSTNYVWLTAQSDDTGNSYLACFKLATKTPCNNAKFPVVTTGAGLFAELNGVDSTACAGRTTLTCMNANGSAFASPTGLRPLVRDIPADSYWNSISTTDHVHYYWTYLWGSSNYGNSLACFNAATNSACANFPISYHKVQCAGPYATNCQGSGNAYTITPDPNNPNIVWSNSDSHELICWNTLTGQANCPPPANTSSADYSFTATATGISPSYSCSSGDNTSSWGTLTVESDTSNATSYSVSILDSNGSAISGWQNVDMTNVNGVPTLDLSTLSTSATGLNPSFVVVAHGFGTSGTVKLGLTRTADLAQLCVTVQAIRIPCPSLATLAAGGWTNVISGSLTASYSAVGLNGAGSDSTSTTIGSTTTDPNSALSACEQNPHVPTWSGVSDTSSGINFTVTAPTDTGGAPASDMKYYEEVAYKPWGTGSFTADNGGPVQISLGSNSITTYNGQPLAGGSYCVTLWSTNSHGSSWSKLYYSNGSSALCRDHAVVPSTPTPSRVFGTIKKGATSGVVYTNFAAPYNGLATTYSLTLKDSAGNTLATQNATSTGYNAFTVTSGLTSSVTVVITATNSRGTATATSTLTTLTPVN